MKGDGHKYRLNGLNRILCCANSNGKIATTRKIRKTDSLFDYKDGVERTGFVRYEMEDSRIQIQKKKKMGRGGWAEK